MTGTRLPRSAPAAKGVDPAGIAGFLDTVEATGLELHSLMLFRGGAVVAEGWWRPYAPERPHMQHSAAKSWTAAALGIALGDGLLSVRDKVFDLFPEHLPPTVSAYLAAMTVEDLLTMRTGHRAGISGGEWRGLRSSWIAAFLREPVEDPPGRDFIYSSGSSYMISAIVTRLTGQTVRDYLEPRLFRPLGMGPIDWDVSPEGVSTGGNGLSCTTEDVLKFGVLHLNGGLWDGRRILPEAWVRDATRNHVDEVWIGQLDGRRYLPRDAPGARPPEKREGYGYQWWMTRDGGYRASGLFGQQCVILPAQDAVIAVTAGLQSGDPRLMEAVWAHLVPALGTADATAAAAQPALTQRLAALALPEEPGAPQAALAAEVSGRRYVMDANEDQVSEVCLHFSEEVCLFTLRDHRGEHRVEVGLGVAREGETGMSGRMLHHQYEPDRMRVVARGVWIDPHRFRMTWRFVETAFCDTVLCTFDGESLRLERRVNTNAGPLERPPLSGRLA